MKCITTITVKIDEETRELVIDDNKQTVSILGIDCIKIIGGWENGTIIPLSRPIKSGYIPKSTVLMILKYLILEEYLKNLGWVREERWEIEGNKFYALAGYSVSFDDTGWRFADDQDELESGGGKLSIKDIDRFYVEHINDNTKDN